MTLQWNTWPESHHGPVIDYLAKCEGDCTAADKESLSFFKLAATGVIDAAANQWTVNIPESLAPGNYVLRHEIIALHSAGQENGAQAYPQCINIEVTGSGSADPCSGDAECVAGTALYTAADEGIKYDIYGGDIASYPIPGPSVWSGAAAKLRRSVARAFSA
jgi:cellulase